MTDKYKEVFNFFSDQITLLDDKRSIIEVLRTGTIQDRGLKITKQMLDEYVKNFKENVYGTELQVNLEHNRGSEAQGWIKDLTVEQDSKDSTAFHLMATVEWTEAGADRVKKQLFKFVSAELTQTYPHHETGKMMKNVFVGLALTNTPALKGQQPVTLKENLSNTMFKELLAELKTRAIVSPADKAFVKLQLAKLSEDEQKEVAADVADVEKKPEEAKKEEPAKEVLKEKAPEVVALEEQVKTMSQQLTKRDMTDLAETMMVTTLSQKAGAKGIVVGFLGEDAKVKLVDFLAELTQEQRESFTALIAGVRTVDLATRGSSGAADGEPDGDEYDEKVAKMAAKMMKEDKELSVEKAQKMAAKELKSK